MSSRFTTSAVAVAVAIAVGLALATGGAAAVQSNQVENATGAAENASEAAENATDALEDDQPEVEEWVDSDVALTGWEYDEDAEEFILHLDNRGDRPKTVTVSQRGDTETAGASAIAMQNHRVLPGENTVKIGLVNPGRQPAVALSTSDGIDEGRGVAVSAGSRSTSWFTGQPNWDHVFLAVLVSLVGTFWGTKRYLEKRERKQQERQVEVVG